MEPFHFSFSADQSSYLGIHPGTCSSRWQSFFKQVSLAEHHMEAWPCSDWLWRIQSAELWKTHQNPAETNLIPKENVNFFGIKHLFSHHGGTWFLAPCSKTYNGVPECHLLLPRARKRMLWSFFLIWLKHAHKPSILTVSILVSVLQKEVSVTYSRIVLLCFHLQTLFQEGPKFFWESPFSSVLFIKWLLHRKTRRLAEYNCERTLQMFFQIIRGCTYVNAPLRGQMN